MTAQTPRGLVSRVSDALFHEMDRLALHDVTEEERERLARAVLAVVREALREPTPEMQEAGARAIACHSAPSGAQQWEALACWRAMLAASALREDGA